MGAKPTQDLRLLLTAKEEHYSGGHHYLVLRAQLYAYTYDAGYTEWQLRHVDGGLRGLTVEAQLDSHAAVGSQPYGHHVGINPEALPGRLVDDFYAQPMARALRNLRTKLEGYGVRRGTAGTYAELVARVAEAVGAVDPSPFAISESSGYRFFDADQLRRWVADTGDAFARAWGQGEAALAS